MMQDPGILRTTLSVIFIAALAHIDNPAAAQTAPGAFGKLTPINNATGQATTVLLQWQSSSGAASYQYCLDTTLNSTCDGDAWIDIGGGAVGVIRSALAAGTTFEWQVRASNTSGQTLANAGAWWRFTTRVLSAGTYFLDDLETTGALGWGSMGTWAVTTESAHSPTHAWSDSPQGAIPDQPHTISSPQINLSAALRPQLTFWHRYDFGATASGTVSITLNGGISYIPLRTFTGSSPTWQKVTLDLTPYAGSLQLMVVFDVNIVGLQTADGWYVDDIRIAEPFTDDPLVPHVTPARMQHISDLRGRINELRTRFGLSPFAWAEAIVPTLTPVRAQHIAELRGALVEVYTQAQLPVPTFTDPVLVQSSTPIRAAHIQELRAAVIAIE